MSGLLSNKLLSKGTIDQAIPASNNLLGNLSFTGTYASALSSRTYSWGYNSSGHVLLILQGEDSTAYENVMFSLTSAPEGISLLDNFLGNWAIGNSRGALYGCIIQGVTAPINISIAVNTRDATYDYNLAELTITYV